MTTSRYVLGFLLLLAYLYAGEGVARLAHIPVPGSVVGMVLLTVSIRLRLVSATLARPAAGALLRRMSLFFVPPGVGLMVYFDLLRSEWPAIVGGSIVGAVAVLGVVGRLQQRLETHG